GASWRLPDTWAGRGRSACPLGEGGRGSPRRPRAVGARVLPMVGGGGAAGRWAPHRGFHQRRVRRAEGGDRSGERLVGGAERERRVPARDGLRGSRAAEAVALRD